MHILKIIHGYPPTYNAGSEVYSQSVCRELSKVHHVSVFTREENLYARDFSVRHIAASPSLDIYVVNNPQGKDGYRHAQMDAVFEELLLTLKPEVAYIGHLSHLSTGIVDVLHRHAVPIVFMLHDYWLMCPRGQFLTRSIGRDCNFALCTGQEDRKCAESCYEVYFSGHEDEREREITAVSQWIKRRMETTRSFINKVDLFIAPARYLYQRFVTDFGLPERKIVYLDYGFPLEYLQPPQTPRCPHSPFTFGYIGTHIPAKGVNMLIEAFSGLQGDARLRIYGRSNGQSTVALREQAAQCRLPVEFCGEYVNSELVDRVFNQVDCIVVPSIWAENSPLVIHEAQACHIPVITAAYGGMAEYVHHHDNGLLFKHRDTASLREQMQWAVMHAEELLRMGQRGYLYSEDGRVVSIEAHCQILSELFRNVQRK